MLEPIRFLQISDLHIRFHAPKGDKLAEVLAEQIRPLELVRQAMREGCAHRPAFVLLTGDLVHEGGAEEYAALEELLCEELPGVPVVALPGNHDDRPAFCAHLLHEPPHASLDRVFELEGLRVIALDTGVDGVITQEQTGWLKDILCKPAPRGTLLAMHHQLCRQSPLQPAQYPMAFRDLVAQSDISGIFCGHTHENWFGAFAGVPYVTADACSFTVEEQDGCVFCLPRAGYVLAELGPQGLSVQMKRVSPPQGVLTRFLI